MPRIVTYGRQPATAPKGTFRAIHFEPLMLLDQGTVEGFISRLFESDGGAVRDGMPLTISMQYVDMHGHDQAVPVGALHEVTINGEAGQMTGKGWLVDTPDGHLAEILVVSQAMHHNSADIGEIPPGGLTIVEHGDYWDDDFRLELRYNQWKLAKSTLVATPAFAVAAANVPDEIAASLGGSEPLVIDTPALATSYSALEMTASMASLPSFDHFHRPEADIPHKIMVDEPDANGWCAVYGHLARWGQPHTGIDGANTYAPRSLDDYARFCQPSVLTDKGMVRTGPIVLYGGHVSLKEAADDPKNAWADVRVVDGRHGPWVCGVARPHISHEMAERYTARASRLSGHWKGGHLRMIISCSAEAFPVDWRPEADELVASFSVDEAPAGMLMIPRELLSLQEIEPDAQQRILDWARGTSMSVNVTTPEVPSVEPDGSLSPTDFDIEAARRQRERELALEAEAGR